MVAQFLGSQATTSIPDTLPGGDPDMVLVPPLVDIMRDRVFLTPPGYAFDFLQVVAFPSAQVRLDDRDVTTLPGCTQSRVDGCVDRPGRPCEAPRYIVHRCQLSFPGIDGTPPRVLPGRQGDGIHVLTSRPAPGGNAGMLTALAWGFDRQVSYAYLVGMVSWSCCR